MGSLLQFPGPPEKRRPYGTRIIELFAVPMLKRGANNRCASGAKVIPTQKSGDNDYRTSGAEGGSVAFFFASGAKAGQMGFWIKAAQAVLLAVAVCFSMGATNAGARYQYLNHRLMCVCGCAEILGECNHVGCTDSAQELSELRTDIAAGMSDQQIFDAFVGKYGATVLAAPPAQGFDLVAWIAPFAVLLAALLGTFLLIRRWGGFRGFKPQPASAADLAGLDPEERDRLAAIRRETDLDSGFDGGSSR